MHNKERKHDAKDDLDLDNSDRGRGESGYNVHPGVWGDQRVRDRTGERCSRQRGPKGAQLVDGTGGEPVADSVILIDDGRVRAAGLGFSYPGGSSSGFTNTSTTEKEARAVVCEQAALGTHFTKMWINEVAEAARRSTPRRRRGRPGTARMPDERGDQ